MAESESAGNAEVNANQNAGQVRLERIYLKDASFESPHSPEVFANRGNPEFQLDINSRTTGLGQDRIEVVLAVTLRARIEGGKTAFIAEVHHAGVFQISGFDVPTTQRIVGTFCPGTLFPYVRETIDSLVVRGGFPAVNLAPVNFEALFAEALRKQGAAGTQTPPVAH